MSLRLYRTSWLVAGVALVVALLTLQSPGPAPEPELPPAFDAVAARTLSDELIRLVPERPPGAPANERSAEWIAQKLQDVLDATPGGASPRRVQRQEFVARADGRTYALTNVFAVLPPTASPAKRSAVLVVAPRDTPPGVSGGTSGTAILVELARSAAARARHRPLIFLSTDGSTIGNAGVRWFLHRNSRLPFLAAVVLDAPGEAGGDRVRIWSFGRSDRHSLELARLAEQAVGEAQGRGDGPPSLGEQVLRLGVPQSFGDQGPLIARGIPAVALSGRGESPLSSTAAPTEDRLDLVGTAAAWLVGSLEAADSVAAPDGSIAFSGRRLRPTIVRIALLLLALPVLVLAVDGYARARRARLTIGRGLRSLAWRGLPAVVALLAAYLLSLVSLIPPSAAGAPPLPQAAALDGPAAGGVVAVALISFLTWLGARRRVRAARALAGEEAAAALLALAALIVLAWLTRPFALALLLPAAHAALVAAAARRAWQVVALAAVGVLPLLALCVSVGGMLGGNAVGAAWYLLATSADGSRGWAGPMLATLAAVVLWSLGGVVAFRARKGLVAGADLPAGVRRPGGRR